MTEIHKEKV